MRKFLISLILALIFTAPLARCEDALFLGVPYQDTNNKMNLPNVQKQEPPKVQEEQKKGIFSKFKKKNNDKKYNYDTNKLEEVPKGYYGTLPDIARDFKYKQQTVNSNRDPEAKIPTRKELEEENLKQAPYDDALFLDVIVKKEKASNYINDIQKTKFILNSLKTCIEEQGSIQRFNGCVNLLDLNVKNLENKYSNSSDSLKESYSDILNTTYYSKLLGNLMYDANYYARYIPTQQGKYSKENIELKKKDLLNKINKTLFIIANES